MDIDKSVVTMEAEQSNGSEGGLFVPKKEKLEFRPPERKSLLGINFYPSIHLYIYIINRTLKIKNLS